MKVVLVARQVGTAAAFVPVARALEPSRSLLLYPLAHAYVRREHEDVPGTAVDDASVIAELERAGDFSVLVTGTSEAARADREQWHWARSRGIPSLAYLDQYVNLELRFVSSRAADWPAAIATISERDSARIAELAPAGVAIHTVGSPAVERFAGEVARQRAPQAGRVLFATEPVTGATREDYRRTHGFTDEDAFALAASALGKTGNVLVLRLHPRDDAARWREPMADARGKGLTVDLDDEARTAASVARAQVVCGTRSMLLVEAACAGVPVVSLQPGRRTPSPLTDEQPGIRTAEREDEAFALLRAALSAPPSSAAVGMHAGACERFVRAIAGMAAR